MNRPTIVSRRSPSEYAGGARPLGAVATTATVTGPGTAPTPGDASRPSARPGDQTQSAAIVVHIGPNSQFGGFHHGLRKAWNHGPILVVRPPKTRTMAASAAAERTGTSMRATMLPLALYLCTLCAPAVLRNGARRPDGSVARLDDGDYARCVLAAGELSAQCRALDAYACRAPGDPCVAPARCRDAVRDMLYMHVRDEGPCALEGLLVRPDRRTLPPAAWTQHCARLCVHCTEDVLRRFEAECRAVRKKLPEFFSVEVEGWE